MAARKQGGTPTERPARAKSTSTGNNNAVPYSELDGLFGHFDQISEGLRDAASVLMALTQIDDHVSLTPDEIRRVAMIVRRHVDKAVENADAGAQQMSRISERHNPHRLRLAQA